MWIDDMMNNYEDVWIVPVRAGIEYMKDVNITIDDYFSIKMVTDSDFLEPVDAYMYQEQLPHKLNLSKAQFAEMMDMIGTGFFMFCSRCLLHVLQSSFRVCVDTHARVLKLIHI